MLKWRQIKATAASTACEAAGEPFRQTVRGGTKTFAVLALLRREQGATAAEIMAATGWQAHSVRGFLSGTVVKKLQLTLVSSKNGLGQRVYMIQA